MYTIASLGRKVQGGREAEGKGELQGGGAHFSLRSQNRLLKGDDVTSKLGFEARVGVLVDIRESALLVDQEQLGWLAFLATKAADGGNSCFPTSRLDSL